MMTSTSTLFYTHRQITRKAWADLRGHRIYGQLVLLGLVPFVIHAVFSLLALAGGAAVGFKLHHLERFWDFSASLRERMLWVGLRELMTSFALAIGLYAAITIVRRGELSVVAVLLRTLTWRYMLGFVMVYAAIAVQLVIAALVAVFIIASALFAKGNLIIAFVAVMSGLSFGAGTWLYLMLQYAPILFIMKDHLDHDEDWNLFGLFRESRRLMRGCKFDLFQQLLPLTPLFILEMFTFGIANVFFDPYINLVLARFYDNRVRFETLEREMMAPTSDTGVN